MDQEQVDILLVDDQPAKLLAYEVILKELGENLVVATSGREARLDPLWGALGPRSAGISPQERSRRYSRRRLHARARRLRTRGHDPRASALPENRDDFHFRDSGFRHRPSPRL